MRALIIIGIIVLALFLLMQIRVGGSAEYSADGFSADAVIACFRIRLFPRPKLTPIERDKKAAEKEKNDAEKKKKKAEADAKKAKKKKSDKPENSEKKSLKIGGTVELILDLLPVLGKFLSGLWKKIRINRLNIDLTVGGGDAAAVAIAYGRISSVGPYIISWAEENLDLREHHVQVTPDFLSGATMIAIEAQLTYTIGQLLWILLKAAFSALAVFIRHKTNRKNKK